MKSTKAEILKRVEEVLQIRLAGAEFVDIRQHASENGWGVSDRQLWRYIQKTDAILARTLERDRQKLLDRHLAQRHALYARAMSVSDYRTALAVLKDQAELQGLYPGGRTGLQGAEAGGSGAGLEAIATMIIQNITLTFPDAEVSAERLMATARQLRQQAAALEQEKSHDTNGQRITGPR